MKSEMREKLLRVEQITSLDESSEASLFFLGECENLKRLYDIYIYICEHLHVNRIVYIYRFRK